MGANLIDEAAAVKRAHEIPKECREFISHHVRNGLVSIMGLVMARVDEPAVFDALEAQIMHIASDLDKVGL